MGPEQGADRANGARVLAKSRPNNANRISRFQGSQGDEPHQFGGAVAENDLLMTHAGLVRQTPAQRRFFVARIASPVRRLNRTQDVWRWPERIGVDTEVQYLARRQSETCQFAGRNGAVRDRLQLFDM